MKNLLVTTMCVSFLLLVFFAGPVECKQDTITASPSTINLTSLSNSSDGARPWFFIHSEIKLADLPVYFETTMYLVFATADDDTTLKTTEKVVFEDQTGGLVVQYDMDMIEDLLSNLLGGPGSANVSVTLFYDYVDVPSDDSVLIGNTTIKVLNLPATANEKAFR